MDDGDDATAPAAPEWMRRVVPGRLDHRILDQGTFWVTGEAKVLRLTDMSRDHLVNIAAMLGDIAVQLHVHALAQLIYDDEDGLALELDLYELTGTCIATVTPGTGWPPHP